MTEPRIIVTGMTGTVAPALARCLEARGARVTAWDRSRVPADDAAGGERFFDEVQPAGVAHLAMGDPAWAERLARSCAQRGLWFLYTSSVSVFAAREPGPIPPDRAPDATDDYGRYKADCEHRVRAAHPAALIARLGWQIANDPVGNTMIRYFAAAMQEKGFVEASARWFPSCAFLDDTAEALCMLVDRNAPGTFHLEANDGFSMLDLARRLDRTFRLGLNLRSSEAFQYDNRMCDDRVELPPLSSHLGLPDGP